MRYQQSHRYQPCFGRPVPQVAAPQASTERMPQDDSWRWKGPAQWRLEVLQGETNQKKKQGFANLYPDLKHAEN